MIELQQLTKKYGDKVAVDGISATVRPGVVTGFLGPNGAGKSTTMRMIVGLDRPTSGTALVNGRPYAASRAPLAEVGALLDAKAADGGRTARNHLLALGATVGIGKRRVDEVLASVGLTEVAHKSAGSFSLGMGQRLGIAAALLADPEVLILDEPVNGLDLDGIQWIRALLTELADEGRTVLLSSHLMSEMQLVADHLLVIGQGRILADTSIEGFIEESSGGSRVVVASPDAGALARLLTGDGVVLTTREPGRFEVRDLTAAEIGDVAAEHGLRIHELTPVTASLESAYLELTRDRVEFTATAQHPARTDRTARTARPATDDTTKAA
ncbi:ATP-binding cassette domain-containing protein [Saccharothrix deserti]|uniref:ATP-binding cassette domain-containing protein n=1 Tax=Saccharothrix deserti TaxID=2593674 RepID=UPI00131CAADE|nr:ATP-binding cassette domain-containing protein [Saccharothrix deserti]